MIKTEHVKGKNKGKIMLYSLSTCIWCSKVKELLEDLGVDYNYVYVDLLNGSDKTNTLDEIKKHNPRSSFPTLVINDKNAIVGFKEDEIRKVIE
jgi:glutaredoxin-like protein NrdH